jgi:hypothetical protein
MSPARRRRRLVRVLVAWTTMIGLLLAVSSITRATGSGGVRSSLLPWRRNLSAPEVFGR